MRERGDGSTSGKVVSFAAARRRIAQRNRLAARACRKKIATSLHIEIHQDGAIRFPPLVLNSAHAIVLLKIVLAVSSHLVEVHGAQIN
jgi:hypothetical protein